MTWPDALAGLGVAAGITLICYVIAWLLVQRLWTR